MIADNLGVTRAFWQPSGTSPTVARRSTLDGRGDLQDDLDGLEPPDELADQHDDFVAVGREQEETFESLIDEIEQSDDPAATFTEQIPELNDQIEESNGIVDEIGGLEECEGEPIPTPGDAPG